MALKPYQLCCLLLALAMPALADFDCSKTPDVLANEESVNECCVSAKENESGVTQKCKDQPNEFCQLDCVFNETKIIENNALNHAHLEAYLKAELRQHDAELIPLVTEAFEKCFSLAKENYDKDDSETCNTMPLIVASCVTLQVFVHCPAQRWKSSPACEEAKTFIEHCPLRDMHQSHKSQ